MKKLILGSLAVLVFGSCANDDFLGQANEQNVQEGMAAIEFGSRAKAFTRATHEESARLLNNKFYVYGTKTLNGATSAIFDNYLVEYEASSAGSTESNSADWEYVGKISKKGATQNTKYWDYSAQRYNFVATTGIGNDEFISNTTDGFRLNIANVDALTDIYVADRVTATPTAQAATGTTPATQAYGNTIELQFRRLGSRMRLGFYETLPGYAIKDLVFYYIGAPSGSYEVGVGSAFPTSGKISVTYDDATDAAVTTFAGADNKMEFSNTFGTLDYTSAASQAGVAGMPYIDEDGTPTAAPVNKFLGTTSADATYAKGTYTIDGEAGVYSDFKPIFPNEHNTLKFQMRLDYTLVALDGSGDEIQVHDAYVSVPVEYLQWKPNYSYTYLFKITDQSNGYTGPSTGDTTTGPGRDPDPDNGGSDNDPIIDPETGEVIPPYVPDPSWPEIPDPDDPTNTIPDPDAPLIPNPDYPAGPDGDQHDPSNPIPDPTIDDPDNPGTEIPDPTNPSTLFPITFDAVIIDAQTGNSTIYTIIDGTINSSETEH